VNYLRAILPARIFLPFLLPVRSRTTAMGGAGTASAIEKASAASGQRNQRQQKQPASASMVIAAKSGRQTGETSAGLSLAGGAAGRPAAAYQIKRKTATGYMRLVCRHGLCHLRIP
jgi:hypothetical protein